MKINKVLVFLIIICTFMSGCERESKEIKQNLIYPMQLESNETNLVNLLEGSNSTVLLTTTLDDSFSNVKIFIESYCDGVLVDEQTGLNFKIDGTLDLAIKPQDVSNWDINASSGNVIVSGNLNMEKKIDPDEDILQAWSFLNYEVSLKLNEPQIIGVYYFNDSNTMGFEGAVYEKNKIDNMEQYKYLYVMKIVFE